METQLLSILLFILAGLLCYFYTNYRIARRYTDQGVIYFGDFIIQLIRTWLTGKHITDNYTRKYNMLKKANQKFGFELEFFTPTFIISDLELIKDMTIKSFDHFVNMRRFSTSKNKQDLIARNIVQLTGQEWKAVRFKMMPAFSKAQLKRMFYNMNSIGGKLVKHLRTRAEEAGNGVINMEEGISKFTMEFTSSVAFGWDPKILESKHRTEFEEMALKFRIDTVRMICQFVVDTVCPAFASYLGSSIVSMKAQNFFRNLVITVIKFRENNKDMKYYDFIEYWIQLRDELKAETELKTNNRPQISLEDEDIVAHSVGLFMAGFESVQNALQFAVYNLVVWPDVQRKLYKELRQAVKESDGEINYETIEGLTYFNAVISESLRIFPVASVTTRTCNKDYIIPNTSILIPKGSGILFPIGSILNDPDYFPNPDKFDPERFLLENRTQIPAGANIPFGEGPRMCVGMRFALDEMKIALAYIVLNFKLKPCEKTQIPMKLASNSISTKPSGGVWVRIKSRQ